MCYETKSKELIAILLLNKTIYRGILDEESKKGIVLSSILAISMFMGACSSNGASTGSKDSNALQKMTVSAMWLLFQKGSSISSQAVKKELSKRQMSIK